MKTSQKQLKTIDGKKSYSLSREESVETKETDLVVSILNALHLSFQNNVDDLPVDYKSTIRLLYEKLIKLRMFPKIKLTEVESFKLAEAANDLAMAFQASYQHSKNTKDRMRAESFYLDSIRICPLSISYFNYFSLLKANDQKHKIERLYKDMLEAQHYKMSQKEIIDIFFNPRNSL